MPLISLCQQQVRKLLHTTPAQLQVKEEAQDGNEVATESAVQICVCAPQHVVLYFVSLAKKQL